MQFFLALVDPTDTTFNQSFARNDWDVLSFQFEHKEGGFAGLSVEIKNPGHGLLAGQVWAWLSIQPAGAPEAIPFFFGRIVGIPSSFVQEAMTVELIARPLDYAEQKEIIAAGLRELPWYDPIFLEESRRLDPDVLLETYTARWHADPVTLEVSMADILIGESELLEFTADEMFYEGFDATIANESPLRKVQLEAQLSWTQSGQGDLSLTNYLLANWPNETPGNYATSFTLRPDQWPKAGAGIGENWTVKESTCAELYPLEVLHRTDGARLIVNWWDGVITTIDISISDDYLSRTPPGSIAVNSIITDETVTTTYQDDRQGGSELSSWRSDIKWTNGLVALGYLIPTLIVEYKAERPCEEIVSFTMGADVQPIVTLPGDDEVEIIDDIRSVNLSEPLDDSTDPEIPIVDPRRRSYICTERGGQSLVHLLLLARARLLRRSRAVEITFAPTLDRLFDISLLDNARIFDPRLPGGQADGKIIAWRFGVNGDSGEIDFQVTMGCAVGNNGSIVESAGEPTWIEDYIEDDYQEHTGQVVAFNSDIGYEPPIFNPNDDGIDFIAGVDMDTAIETGLAVTNSAAVQRPIIQAIVDEWKNVGPGIGATPDQIQQLLQDRADAINAVLEGIATEATFKLKSMKREFSSPYPIEVEDLKVPMMIDLSAES